MPAAEFPGLFAERRETCEKNDQSSRESLSDIKIREALESPTLRMYFHEKANSLASFWN
jgi:hypothetical protein